MKKVLRLIIPILLICFGTLQSNYSLAQGWERTFGGNFEDNAYSVIQTSDGGYALLGFSESASSVGTNVILIKTDADGRQQWKQSFGGAGDDKGYEVIQDRDENYVIVGQTSSMGNGEDDVLLIKADSKGREKWRKSFGGPYNDRGFSIALLENGGYVLTGRTEPVDNESANVYLIKTDKEGNLVWQRTFGGEDIDIGEAVIETSAGEIVVVGQTKSFATPNPNSPNAPSADVYLIRVSAAGETIAQKTFGNLEQDIAFDVVETTEGNLALAGVTTNNSDVYLLMLDPEGNALWSKSYGGIFDEIAYSIDKTADGGFIIAGLKTVTPTSSQVYLLKTDGLGELEWERLFGSSAGQDVGRSVVSTSDGGYIVGGNYDINTDPESLLPLYDMYLVKTDGQGNIFENVINGSVFRDMNTNCEKDTDEKTLKDWLIRLRQEDKTLYATTDDHGNYSISVEDGNYNVGVVVLNSAWEVCQNYNVAFNENDTMQLDFAVRSTVDNCPILVTDVSTAFLKPCRESTYTISICNRGIEEAKGTYIDVRFDDYLTVNYSTLPWADHVGNIYRFDIGDLAIEECGSFDVNTTLSCEALVGQAHCVEAYAHPDPICIPPPPLWDGASIRVDGDCVGDSVRFVLKNVGDGNMAAPAGFVVIIDDIMLREASGTFQLPSGLADTFYVAANSATYRIIAEQPSGHPYGQSASAVVEGCPFGQPFNTGFVTAFSDSDALPFYSVDCRENQLITGNASLTPSPKGVGNNHFISKTDDLEYHIFFQNTGSDTVNQVVIRDTLSPLLDLTTLVPGSSSHAYDFEISGTGILKMTIKNAELLPVSEEEAKSYGFVKFRISQKRGNADGAVIENQAVVSFDYSAPVYTNITQHTLGGETVEDFIEISTGTETVYQPGLEVTIRPNPFEASLGTTLELTGLDYAGRIQFDLFDVSGRSVQQAFFAGDRFLFRPEEVPSGLYIYTLRIEGQVINSGKVFIK